jgi:hypothetical protein
MLDITAMFDIIFLMSKAARLTPTEEKQLNDFGDQIAATLMMQEDKENSPDTQGRKRWKTTEGNKTGLGLMRTLERMACEALAKTGRA